MTRSLAYLRRGLMGLAVAGSLGFGATQAFARPDQTAQAKLSCPAKGYDYYYAACAYNCPGRQGYCSEAGICRCGQIP